MALLMVLGAMSAMAPAAAAAGTAADWMDTSRPGTVTYQMVPNAKDPEAVDVVFTGDGYLKGGEAPWNDGTKKLASITLSEGIRGIGAGAFKGCTGLTAVTLPSTLEEIADEAFAYTGIASIALPATLNTVNGTAFMGSAVCDFSVASGNTAFTVVDGVLFTADGKTLAAFPSGRSLPESSQDPMTYEIPATVTAIGAGAFAGSKLNTISIPDNVETIGKSAFCDCAYLGYVRFHEGLVSIGDSAFAYCSSLYSVSLPGTVSVIGNDAFLGATIDYIYLPKSLTSVGTRAFGYVMMIDFELLYELIMSGDFTLPTEDLEDPENYEKLINDVMALLASMDVNDLLTIEKNEEFTVYGSKGSVAESYANANGFSFLESPLEPTFFEWVESTDEGIYLAWTPVCDADGYRLYRRLPGKTWEVLKDITDLDQVEYIDTTVTPGQKYVYTIRSFKGADKAAYQKIGTGITYLTAVQLVSISNAGAGPVIKWKAVPGAESYTILRKTASQGWEEAEYVNDVEASVLSYKDVADPDFEYEVKSGTTYTYTVVASAGMSMGAINTTGISIKYLSAPKLKGAKNTGSGVQVTWSKVTGATGYFIYRKTAKSGWSRVGAVKGNAVTAFKDTTAKSGVTYTYTVRATSGSYGSSYYPGITDMFLSAPKLSSASKSSKGITVKYGAVKGATSYNIYRKTGNGGWSKIAVVKGNSKTSYVDTKAKAGVKYTYTVRAVNGKYISSFYSGVSGKR